MEPISMPIPESVCICSHKASAVANLFSMLVANADDETPRPDKMGVPLLSDPEVYKGYMLPVKFHLCELYSCSWHHPLDQNQCTNHHGWASKGTVITTVPFIYVAVVLACRIKRPYITHSRFFSIQQHDVQMGTENKMK